jgi:hypothetical protein
VLPDAAGGAGGAREAAAGSKDAVGPGHAVRPVAGQLWRRAELWGVCAGDARERAVLGWALRVALKRDGMVAGQASVLSRALRGSRRAARTALRGPGLGAWLTTHAESHRDLRRATRWVRESSITNDARDFG